jgi:2-oxo-3-hexenedioate decarboxylase
MMGETHERIAAAADRLLAAAAATKPIEPFTDADPEFSLDAAHAVADEILKRRVERGERVVGWKIGFTNRNIWEEYGVHAPIWGAMYDSTVQLLEAGAAAECSLHGLAEPRIEPEVALRLAAVPQPGMDERELLFCVDAVTHGFEIVQSVYPGWRFRAADTVAAFALHGRFLHGPLVEVEQKDAEAWLARLRSFAVVLTRAGERIDRGEAADVLGGPLSALRHMVEGMAARPFRRGLMRGDIVTTGTVTRAFPIRRGDVWQSRVYGLPVAGLAIRFFD